MKFDIEDRHLKLIVTENDQLKRCFPLFESEHFFYGLGQEENIIIGKNNKYYNINLHRIDHKDLISLLPILEIDYKDFENQVLYHLNQYQINFQKVYDYLPIERLLLTALSYETSYWVLKALDWIIISRFYNDELKKQLTAMLGKEKIGAKVKSKIKKILQLDRYQKN